MGSVFSRQLKSGRVWYIKFKDAQGRWRMVPSRQPTKAQAKEFLGEVEGRIRRGQVGIAEPEKEIPLRGMLREWAAGLTNRNARDDRYRLKNHVLPAFGDKTFSMVTVAAVMAWLDDAERKAARITEGSIRHNLNLLSRFFGWAIERGHVSVNPVRQIPVGRRPQQAGKTSVAWLRDDTTVRTLFGALPEPVNLMFYLGNQSGLRTGEICGLRISDLENLANGQVLVRFSYDGPLKEDKRGTGRCKWVPAADDAADVFRDWLERRRAEGASQDDLVFPRASGKPGCWSDTLVSRAWRAVARQQGIRLTWYQATRHSFVSRNLSLGQSLDEVSAAVGHSSPIVTRRYYDHFIRKNFSPGFRTGLGLRSAQRGGAEIVDIGQTRRLEVTEHQAEPQADRAVPPRLGRG